MQFNNSISEPVISRVLLKTDGGRCGRLVETAVGVLCTKENHAYSVRAFLHCVLSSDSEKTEFFVLKLVQSNSCTKELRDQCKVVFSYFVTRKPPDLYHPNSQLILVVTVFQRRQICVGLLVPSWSLQW